MRKHEDIRLVALVSDLHAGSTHGIMPPGFHTKEGNEIGLNAAQKWLWESWLDCWKWFYQLAGKDSWALVANGDMIDGNHHGTKEIWAVDESDHGIAAYHVLKDPALKANAVFLTEGTESHTHGHEHALAYLLKSKGANVRIPKGEGGAWRTLDIEFAKTYCKFDHHIGTTSRSYLEASQFSIALGNMRNEFSRAGHRVPKVICRAHRHRFGVFDDGYGLTVVTPPWQLLTRFGRKVVTEAVPQVGIVVLDWRHTEDDSAPVVHKRLHTIRQSSPVRA